MVVDVQKLSGEGNWASLWLSLVVYSTLQEQCGVLMINALKFSEQTHSTVHAPFGLFNLKTNGCEDIGNLILLLVIIMVWSRKSLVVNSQILDILNHWLELFFFVWVAGSRDKYWDTFVDFWNVWKMFSTYLLLRINDIPFILMSCHTLIFMNLIIYTVVFLQCLGN